MMVDYLAKKLTQQGIEVVKFDVAEGDLGDLAMELVDSCTVVFATSMVLAGPHPSMVTAAYLAGALRPKTKFISFIGSYGWGGLLTKKLEECLGTVKAEKLEGLIVKGKPTQNDLQKLDNLVNTICEKQKDLA